MPKTPFPHFQFLRPQHGKNDPEESGQALWIAATASLLDGILLTTDSDFDHLDGTFLKLGLMERP